VDIHSAYELLAPSLGAKAASIVFALALLASGQNSTITGGGEASPGNISGAPRG